MNTIGKKQEFEEKFTKWVNEDNSSIANTEKLLPGL